MASLAAVVLAAGSGTAWWTWNTIDTPTPAPDAITTQPPAASPIQPAAEQTVQVFWLKDTGSSIELVPDPITLAATNQPESLLTAAFETLLAGPTDPNVASTIPEGTALRSVSIEPNGVHVDLSSAFTSGGGSASMSGRVGQVVYTATTLEPNAKVWINVDGEPLEVLGGEGLIVDQPMTRQDFEQNFML
jgi:spore germination protein GerM